MLAILATTVLLMIFPEITLWLPRTMRRSDLAVIGVRGEPRCRPGCDRRRDQF